jgi:hypothetical protein
MIDHTNDSGLPEEPRRLQTRAIRQLNDRFRVRQVGGTIIGTPGVMDLGAHAFQKIMQDIAVFDDFTADNNPYGENDFGALIYRGTKIFWKIDYYNIDLTQGSADPADPQLTTRVMTVFLASEY